MTNDLLIMGPTYDLTCMILFGFFETGNILQPIKDAFSKLISVELNSIKFWPAIWLV